MLMEPSGEQADMLTERGFEYLEAAVLSGGGAWKDEDALYDRFHRLRYLITIHLYMYPPVRDTIPRPC